MFIAFLLKKRLQFCCFAGELKKLQELLIFHVNVCMSSDD